MNTYYLSALDEQFKYDCKVINLSYEYPGYTGKEKWAIITDLTEDMAAEEKARSTYEHLIDLASTDDVIQPLLFLRQREVVHYNRFKELLEYYKDKYNLKY